MAGGIQRCPCSLTSLQGRERPEASGKNESHPIPKTRTGQGAPRLNVRSTPTHKRTLPRPLSASRVSNGSQKVTAEDEEKRQGEGRNGQACLSEARTRKGRQGAWEAGNRDKEGEGGKQVGRRPYVQASPIILQPPPKRRHIDADGNQRAARR